MKKFILISFICSLFAVFSVTAKDAKITLKGSLKCAKCDLKSSAKCAKVLQTKDGKYYNLMGKKFAKWLKENKSVKAIVAKGVIVKSKKDGGLDIFKVAKVEAAKAKA